MLEPSACIVVGIDGSPAGVDAALWAIEQAVDHDMPLRLVYVVDAGEHGTVDPHDQARSIATAEVALRYALAAVESVERPVKIEVEILQGRPVQTLLEAARSAAMLCIGARGLKHSTQGRIGSTAVALATSALCPVAIVRSHRPHRRDRAVVIEFTDGAVMQRGLAEAKRRRVPARVLIPARTHPDARSHASAAWERRLAEWQRSYPDVEIVPVSERIDTLDYLAAHGGDVQLVVAGRNRPGGVAALVGPPGNAALRDTDCSILVCEPHNVL
ncbi:MULTISPECIES: universal stress protein [Mycolicibacterium]|jgi:nucleotide-binding universal stress UspA family protein|uniref:Universal stress protein n=1 Tax=Mycolicibacterium austroafricanum TaxID=39687 RepID=A0ABT8HAN4_MYCAO|nr:MULTISPECIES: universal stress protein [Mycolicibacterium]MDN4517831.1 universal stress protein [Mycolicibacterium austroafricanum]PQP41810.1 universal stress protein [Mycolicibacterium austroafricanum]QRZ09117.1 universal stress protein [Mycolicibacterium austroafricanum]QZT59292.1 universal stress protein [Mycolicibacterium austroafricanum]QZT70891.1 universal stress protein [Mycolicibacterium austroafricanum]